jgi:hypothetical protein
MREMIIARLIIHDMIVELHGQGWQFQGELVAPPCGTLKFKEFLHVHHEIHDRHTHNRLQVDLTQH